MQVNCRNFVYTMFCLNIYTSAIIINTASNDKSNTSSVTMKTNNSNSQQMMFGSFK